MLKFLKSVGVIALLAFSASQANAGLIVVSGDTNLDFGDIGGLNTFYANMFGGSDVLADNFSGGSWSIGNTQSYMAANAGTFTLGSASATALVGMEWFVASTNFGYSAGELTDIANFISGGGNLFVLGEEPNAYASMNTVANTLLAAVGSTMTIGQPQSASNNWTATGANIGSHVLTTGVTAFGGNFAATVSGGTMLYTTDDTNEVVVAVQGSSSPVPEPTTLALLVLGLLGFTASHRSPRSLAS